LAADERSGFGGGYGSTSAATAVCTPVGGGTVTVTRPDASLEARVDVLERRIIEDCLHRNNFRRKETAAELGISRVTLYNKMKKFGLM
jgi:DNA-binding NtrC family response regulator